MAVVLDYSGSGAGAVLKPIRRRRRAAGNGLLLVGADQFGQRCGVLVHERQTRGSLGRRAKLQEAPPGRFESGGGLAVGFRWDGDDGVAEGTCGVWRQAEGGVLDLDAAEEKKTAWQIIGRSTARARGCPRSWRSGWVVPRQHGARLIGIAGLGVQTWGPDGKAGLQGAATGILGGSGGGAVCRRCAASLALCCVRY